MKKKDYILSAILSIVVCIAAYFIVSQGIDVNVKYNGDPAAVQVSTVPATNPIEAPSTTVAPTTAPSADKEETTVPATEPSDEETKNDSGLPQSPAEILSKYSDLINEANELGVGYNKVEYQAIPPEKSNFEGGIMDKIMPVASTFFVDEETAKSKPENFPKGGDMYWFPLYRVRKGCVLTDVDKIRSAECTELADGNVKIKIVLIDEDNSEPIEEGATTCSSYVGSMFTPIKRAEVDDVLKNSFAVKMLIKDLDYKLTYYDCTAEMIYNPQTEQIVSLDQFMHILITVNSGKVAGANVTGSVVLDNFMYLTEFVY